MFLLIKSALLLFSIKTRSRYSFSSRKLSGVSRTSFARLVKVFIVVALSEVGFLYTVVRSPMLLGLTKDAKNGSFPFSSNSLVN